MGLYLYASGSLTISRHSTKFNIDQIFKSQVNVNYTKSLSVNT